MREENSEKVFIEALKILTERQIQIMDKIAQGKTNSEIARDLYIEKTTVKKHKSNMCKKLQLKGRNALLKWTIKYYKRSN